MKIAIAADHAGFELKGIVKSHLEQIGHELLDLGTQDTAPVDYPDFAEAVGDAVVNRRVERGILICGSGVGVSVAANKRRGIHAGLCHDHYSAHQGVEHDDMNVLCIGARIVGREVVLELVDAFVGACFSGEPRHVTRLQKVAQLEEKYCKGEGHD